MASLIYISNVSLDGFIEDAQGAFDFTDPTDEAFAFITDLIRPVSTFLYGRRLYEAMSVWETDPSLAALSEPYAEFAQAWQDADKVVWSSTLDSAPTARTTIERSFDAAAGRERVATRSGDVAVGGAHLAAQAFEAGLVDECHLFIAPVLLGGGKPGLPSGVRLELELLDQRQYPNGTVYLRHRVLH
jgi:dihydrofolate reductase